MKQMTITQALLGEHGVFYAQFDHLGEALRNSEELALVQSAAALLAAGLASHAGLEEALLLERLDETFGGGGPVAVMRSEHEEIEALLASIQGAKSSVEASDMLLQVIELARGHFAKEEQVLFPMADQILPEPEQLELGSKWAQRRCVTVR